MQMEPEVKAISLALVLAAVLTVCSPSSPETLPRTVEVTRIVEVTRVVEVTRIVELTGVPSTPVTLVVTATPPSGPVDAETKLGLFWVSIAEGQV